MRVSAKVVEEKEETKQRTEFIKIVCCSNETRTERRKATTEERRRKVKIPKGKNQTRTKKAKPNRTPKDKIDLVDKKKKNK